MTGAKANIRSKSAAVALFELLEAADREGFTVPRGTGEITTDAKLCVVMARRSGISATDLFEAFYGKPVRQTRAILMWSQREAPGDLEEQSRMIACWSLRQRSSRRRSRARRLEVVA